MASTAQTESRGRAARWASTTFGTLEIRNYRILWIGTALSFLTFMMSVTAQNVVAFELTGNNGAVGLVMFGQGVAMLILGPFGGAFADRLSKRLLLLVCQVIIGLTYLTTAFLIGSGLITILLLTFGSFMIGTMFPFLGPARQAYLAELVEPERRGNAVALQQVAMNLMRVVGPFLTGALLAISFIGAAGAFYIMAAMYVVIIATTLQLPPTRGSSQGRPSVLAEIGAGLRHVGENPRLLQLIVGFVLITMVGFPYMTVMPGFVSDVLDSGTAGYGLLLGVSALGGLIASLFVAGLADSPRAPVVLFLSSLMLGVGLIVTGLAPSFAAALLTMFVVGAGVSGFQTLNNALALRDTAPAYYGRVMSITMLAFSGTSIVGLPIGLLADRVSERATLVGMGVAVSAIVLLLEVWAVRVRATAPAAGAGMRDAA